MARYIDADKLIDFITKGLNDPDNTKAFGYDAIVILTEIEYAPTADVAPKSEIAKKVLLELKKQIHDKAAYTNSQDVANYVQLKVFDAVLNNVIKKYTEGD